MSVDFGDISVPCYGLPFGHPDT